MTREGVELKGRRYLAEGRLRVDLVDGQRIEATVRGSDGTYSVAYSRGGWLCGCPARGRCAHLVALQLVTTRPTAAEVYPS